MRKNNHHSRELSADQLRWHCSPKQFGANAAADIKPSKEIIGQERALRALRLGLEMKHAGYNVFVTGFSGTGRMTTIKRLLTEFEHKHTALYDHCFVHNFRNNDEPILITLPAGEGLSFAGEMDEMVEQLIKDIPASFDTKRFKDERKRLVEHFQERQQSVLRDFERKVREKGFEVVQVQVGTAMRPDITPVVNEQPVGFEQLEEMLKQGQVTKEKIEQLQKDRSGLESQMEIVLREMRNIERKARESLEELAERFMLPVVKEFVDAIRQKYKNEKVQRYLDEVQDNIMADLNRFRPAEDQPHQVMGIPLPQQEDDRFIEYQVNVVVDNAETKGVPIIIETNPKFKNIFGTIDREVDKNGVWRTDFTLIKPGSLLRADRGYLVINALDALLEPGVWQTLKRTLRNGLLEIQPIESGLFGASSALKPEPIPIEVKVIMLGDAYIYYLLYDQDDDFKKIFKIRADFDTEMPRKSQSIRGYVSFIRMICEEEKLLPFSAPGVGAVVEYGARLAENQGKLSTRFNLIADVSREASYWATKDGATVVTDAHVLKAVDERIERVKLLEDKIQEMIIDGSMMIDTEGAVIGQVNGLTIYDVREYSFGKPARITAKTSIGNHGVINIEREAELSGPTHNKGVMILSGYLHSMYAQKKPLTMNASIAFEQSYGGVDGDSASSTEIYAILSSLAKVPLRQDIAVTGSVNQKGEIQPIGGVNQKIEGFFHVCKARGLTGKQGAIIPHQNKKDLMLRHEVVQAVRRGKFHIYAIQTIDEGIELLTGRKAGKRRKNGSFEKDTIHGLVDQTLMEFARHWKELNQ
jgi:ATP-dependent Lon protease